MEAANGHIHNLTSDLAKINTLINGNLTSDNIHSLILTSDKVTVENGFITNAMIKSLIADKITGVDEAGVHRYYGTDYDGLVGFHEVPDSIYAEDIESSSPDISGIYFTPRENSVAENMLTESVRAKLNKASITSYPELSNLPKINNVEVKGTLTLVDLGIQPAGNYLTEIPDTYALKSYVDSAVSPLLSSNTAATTYATITALNTLESKVNANANTVSSTYSRVFIGSVPSGVTPKKGDLLVDL